MYAELIGLIALLALAASAAAYVVLDERQRRALVQRASGGEVRPSMLRPDRPPLGTRLAEWLAAHAPAALRPGKEVASTLVRAGFDGGAAPATYGTVRVAAMVGLPLLAIALGTAFGATRDRTLYLTFVGLASIVGLLGPSAYLQGRMRQRQERIRRALPDSLDLLLVCVEAGISLDAAILRVAREMAALHAEMAAELYLVNRRVNAGVPREEAMHGLWVRTGVEELRGLAANMIQSERWGTSIATVLRVYAESLRRKRKQAAEKKAATAPLRMLIPLALFIFPTLFIVLLGPSAMRMAHMFDAR